MADGDLAELLSDLRAEHGSLDELVAAMGEGDWATPTPAEGWTVQDQIGHLAFFDEAATLALADPERFAVMAEAALSALSTGGDPMAEHLARGRAMTGAEMLEWWRDARAALVDAAARLAPGVRVPWFGPPMSPMSFVSARLMETWAHGQDVADALGEWRRPSARLRHIAHLGVRARPFSYVVRGLVVPDGAVRVDLVGPSGERWRWDEDAVDDMVEGSALDFCLVVTQRRHLDDTELVVEGARASEWMGIAQAFAGPPGPGRPPARAG